MLANLYVGEEKFTKILKAFHYLILGKLGYKHAPVTYKGEEWKTGNGDSSEGNIEALVAKKSNSQVTT